MDGRKIVKKKITKKQQDLLKRLDKELDSGARDQLQALLKQLENELATQKLEQSCETTKSVTQLVNYNRSFEGRDEDLKFTYHNPNIIDANFKAAAMLKSFEHGSAQREFKVYRPKRRISSDKVITLMKKDGYRPATALEMLEYYVVQLLQGAIVRLFALVALGAVWQSRVVYLLLDPTNRSLNLLSFDGDWCANDEFLAVRESE